MIQAFTEMMTLFHGKGIFPNMIGLSLSNCEVMLNGIGVRWQEECGGSETDRFGEPFNVKALTAQREFNERQVQREESIHKMILFRGKPTWPRY